MSQSIVSFYFGFFSHPRQVLFVCLLPASESEGANQKPLIPTLRRRTGSFSLHILGTASPTIHGWSRVCFVNWKRTQFTLRTWPRCRGLLRPTQDIGPRKCELTHMNYGTNVCFILQSVSLIGVSTKACVGDMIRSQAE